MQRGTLVRRYKRFLADVALADGTIVTAHCPNSGTMATCAEPGRPVILSRAENPNRRLAYTWELIQMGRTWVGVHSAYSNRLVERWLADGALAELREVSEWRREVAYGQGVAGEGKSRVDFMGNEGGRPCYVEVKHCTMRVDDAGAFPDARSERAEKHVEELRFVHAQGARAVMLFIVGRADCRRFRPADEIDPSYGAALRRAAADGVEVLAYGVRFGAAEVTLVGRLPVDLSATPANVVQTKRPTPPAQEGARRRRTVAKTGR